MNSALRTERIALAVTPLSPVHVGCGEDFVPTGYVMQDGWLYAFDDLAPVFPDPSYSQRNAASLTVERRAWAA